jgi:chromosomal replication initiation ATPase DnaA
MLDDWATWPAKRPRSAAAQARWQAVSDRVRDEMTKGNFAIYFSRSRGLGLAEVDGQLTLTVGAPNTSAAEGLEDQFARIIRRALDALGWPDLVVRIVLLPTRTRAHGDEVVDVDGVADREWTAAEPRPEGTGPFPSPDAPRDVRLVAAP